ncbi:hypothetical protein BV22DRAFT_1049678, partial [Leucogyrophana mollusca]
ARSPELDRVVGALNLLESGKGALVGCDANVLLSLLTIHHRRRRRLNSTLGLRRASPYDGDRKDFFIHLQDDEAIFDAHCKAQESTKDNSNTELLVVLEHAHPVAIASSLVYSLSHSKRRHEHRKRFGRWRGGFSEETVKDVLACLLHSSARNCSTVNTNTVEPPAQFQ